MQEFCAVCPKVGQSQCSQCKLAVYCSKECQRTHFRSGHKQKCMEVAKMTRILAQEEATIREMHHPNDPFITGEGTFGLTPETENYVRCAGLFMAALNEIRTVRSIRKLISLMKQEQILCREDRPRALLKIPTHILQLPDPDSLQNCYNLITYCALNSPSETSLLPDYEHLGYNMFDKVPNKLGNFGTAMKHRVPYVLVKIKLYVDLKRFVSLLDTVLLQRDGRWLDSIVMANILPFLWPSEKYLSPAYICAAAGTAHATIGALRALLRRLKAQIGALLPRDAQANKDDIWHDLVSASHAAVYARTMAAALLMQINPQAVEFGTREETDILLCDFIPMLNGDPFPTLVGVRDVLQRYVSGQDY